MADYGITNYPKEVRSGPYGTLVNMGSYYYWTENALGDSEPPVNGLLSFVFTEDGYDADCTYTMDKTGDESREVQDGWCLLGDGTVTIDFGTALDGKDFTYLNGNTGVESSSITYNNTTKWTIPNATKVFAILFEDGQYFSCEEQAGLYLIDLSGNGATGTLSANTVWNSEQWVYSHANELGYNTKADYTALGKTWAWKTLTLDDDALMMKALHTWVPVYTVDGEPYYVDGEWYHVVDPLVVTRSTIDYAGGSHVL